MRAMRDGNSKGDVDLKVSWNRGLTICSFFYLFRNIGESSDRYHVFIVSVLFFVPAGNKKRRQGNSTTDAPPSALIIMLMQ